MINLTDYEFLKTFIKVKWALIRSYDFHGSLNIAQEISCFMFLSHGSSLIDMPRTLLSR